MLRENQRKKLHASSFVIVSVAFACAVNDDDPEPVMHGFAILASPSNEMYHHQFHLPDSEQTQKTTKEISRRGGGLGVCGRNSVDCVVWGQNIIELGAIFRNGDCVSGS